MPDAIEVLNSEVEKLGKTLHDLQSDFETKIQDGIKKDKGVAELKESANKAIQDVASITDKMQTLKEEIDTRADEFEMKMKEKLEASGKVRKFKTPGEIVIDENVKRVKGYTRNDDGVEISGDPSLGFSDLRKRQGSTLYTFKNWGLSYGQRQMRALKAITDAAGSGEAALDQMRVPGLISPGERRLMIRDLIMIGRTSESAVEFVRESSVTDNAGPQATQGTAKGESDFVFTIVTANVRTVAHWVLISTQMLSDVPALESYVDGRMTFLLLQAEEDSLLTGDGTSGDLLGLIPQATAYSTALETALSITSAQAIDRLRVAILQVQEANHVPDGIALSARDWASIELLKDTENAYLFVNPQNQTAPRLWGLPVVATTAFTSPQFLVGAFMSAAQIWDREDASVMISTEDSTNFRDNMATMRAEERLALTVYNTDAFVEGNTDGSGSGS